MSGTTTLHYVYDPLCGWCYAAAPMVDAVAATGQALALHGGGLWEPATGLLPDKAAYIRESDARIASTTGQTFGDPYLRGLLDDPTAVFWSEPTIAAVLAAGRVQPGAEVGMLHAIQRAHYVDGRHVVQVDVLNEIAASIGLDGHVFGEALRRAAAADHIASTRALMARLDLRGFPGLVLERGSELIRAPHERFYGRPEAFAAAVADLARVAAEPGRASRQPKESYS